MPVQPQVANLSSFQVIPLGDSFLRRPQVGGASSLILAAGLRPLAEASSTYQAVCSLHNFTTAQSQLYPNQHSSKNYDYSRAICEKVANAKRFDLYVVIRPLGRESKHSRTLRGRRQALGEETSWKQQSTVQARTRGPTTCRASVTTPHVSASEPEPPENSRPASCPLKCPSKSLAPAECVRRGN